LIPGANDPCGIAVNSAHVYWTNVGAGTIGRANLDGSAPVQNFISGVPSPCGVAVDASHIYWGNTAGTIGRANLDGSDVDQSFITGANGPCGVAVDGLVRTTQTTVACERNASAFNQPTKCTATVIDIEPAPSPVAPTGTVAFSSAAGGSGFSGGSSCNLAPAGADRSTCTISYLPGAGSNKLQGFYPGNPDAHGPSIGIAGVAVGDFSVGSPALNMRNGTALISATVPGPGIVNLQGEGVVPASGSLASAGTLNLLIAPNSGSARALRKKGKVPVALTVTFVPKGGGPSVSRPVTTTLIKPLKKKKRKHRHSKKGN
jgi:hypothetical protein